MSKVAIITLSQSNELKSFQYNGCNFNPIKDVNNNWVISEEEIIQSNLEWLNDLELIEYQPKETKPSI